MKYNLKNFPVKGTPQAYERWGKGFRKELQEIMPSYGRATINPYDNEKRRIIKEILGE